MKKVVLYWNHICILFNQEKRFLNEIKESLLKQGIDLEIHYFGLGSEYPMSEYLSKEDVLLPDVIVTADLEVVEHKKIFNKLRALHEVESWIKLKDTKVIQHIRRKKTLLPFVAIPLVCYTTDKSINQKSIIEMTKENNFSFGGINNSAGKTITKAVWQLYGKQEASDLLDNSLISAMPIAAFQAVRTNKATTALVPSIYAMRFDNINNFMCELKEGKFILPSFVLARKSIDEQAAKTVIEAICSEAFCKFYAENGDLIICPDYDVKEHKVDNFTVLSQDFINQLEDEEFYNLYTSKIESAKYL